jgi:tetratricopeptide (TPR) repeat protein
MSPAPFPIHATLRDRLGQLGQEFLVDLYDRETTRHPLNLEVLAELAHVLTRLGRIEEGLEVDRRLVQLAPEDPTIHYNLACSLALLGEEDQALEALASSIELGYDDADQLAEDEDLASLREDVRFHELLAYLQGPGGTLA